MAKPFVRNEIAQFQHANTVWNVTVPIDFDPETATDPSLWQLVAEPNRIQAGDEIRIVPQNMAWVARLIVTFRKGAIMKSRRESFVKLLDVAPLEAVEPSEATETEDEPEAGTLAARYKTEWKGPSHKWCVIDTQAANEDAMKVFKGLESKEIAQAKRDELLAA